MRAIPTCATAGAEVTGAHKAVTGVPLVLAARATRVAQAAATRHTFAVLPAWELASGLEAPVPYMYCDSDNKPIFVEADILIGGNLWYVMT